MRATTSTCSPGSTEIGDWVYGYAYSSPAALGWAQVDSNGDATWTLPTLGSGVHHLAVLDANGAIIGTAQFTVASVATTDPSVLAFTGTDSDGALTIALLAVLVGLGMIVVRRRRRTAHAGSAPIVVREAD